MQTFHRVMIFLFFLVEFCGANSALAATNLLLAGVRMSLNVLLRPSIKQAGFDPFKIEFGQEIEGPSLSAGVCKEASINGAFRSMNITGLSSAKINDLEATSASSNFFMTRVAAPTRVLAVVEDGLTLGGDGQVSAKCSRGPFGDFEIAKASVRTTSHVKGVSMIANVTLNLNLITSTIKSAHVDSVRLTFDDVDTSCSIGSSIVADLDGLCSRIDNQFRSRLQSFFEGPLAGRFKDSLQASLDSMLPFGVHNGLLAKAADAPQLPSEPRRLLRALIPVATEIDVLV